MSNIEGRDGRQWEKDQLKHLFLRPEVTTGEPTSEPVQHSIVLYRDVTHVSIDNQDIKLTRTEFELLSVLSEFPNISIPKELLLRQVLRKRFASQPDKLASIQTKKFSKREKSAFNNIVSGLSNKVKKFPGVIVPTYYGGLRLGESPDIVHDTELKREIFRRHEQRYARTFGEQIELMFDEFRFGQVAYIPSEHTIVKRENGRHVRQYLSEKEYQLLNLLRQHRGKHVDTQLIHEQLWRNETIKTVFQTIARLRAKLEPDPDLPQILLTSDKGYVFTG